MRFTIFAGALLSLFVMTSQVFAGIGNTCGESTPCNLSTDLAGIFPNFFTVILSSVLMLVFLSISFTALRSYSAKSAGEIESARTKAGLAALGFLGLLLLTVLAVPILQALGVQEWALKLLRSLSSLDLIPHAYAQGTQVSQGSQALLPSGFTFASIPDLLIALGNVAIRFFLYPWLIFIWVWSGFKLVYAQGSPEGLEKARTSITRAAIITVVVFTLQAFLLAAKVTVEKVRGTSSSTTKSAS